MTCDIISRLGEAPLSTSTATCGGLQQVVAGYNSHALKHALPQTSVETTGTEFKALLTALTPLDQFAILHRATENSTGCGGCPDSPDLELDPEEAERADVRASRAFKRHVGYAIIALVIGLVVLDAFGHAPPHIGMFMTWCTQLGALLLTGTVPVTAPPTLVPGGI